MSGKASKCIQMLELLNSGGLYKISELAYILDTSKRNIIEYKKELENLNYRIVSITGKYGGYYLDKTNLFPALAMNKEEKQALFESLEFLRNKKEFINIKNLLLAYSKIFSSSPSENIIEKKSELLIINRFPLIMSQDDIKLRIDIIKKSINSMNKIILSYLSSENIVKEYEYCPYELFIYNNSWYVIGYDETSFRIGIFKINRIKSIKTLEITFSIPSFYNRLDYLDEFGFKQNGKWFDVVFIAHGKFASYVKERIYGKNQEIEEIDKNSTLVKVSMQNEDEIFKFILGFGKDIEIIKPEWLKSKLKDFAYYVLEKYK